MTSKFEERMRAKTSGSAQKAQATVAARAESGSPRSLETMPAQLGAFRLEAQEYQRKIETLQAKLEEALKNGSSGIDIPLDKLHEIQGRRRYMSPEEYRDLRENLRTNELNQPIVVDMRADGEFELVSGHHRSDAYRELGRLTIRGVLRANTAENPAVAAFYANLFQSPLTDFEKYLGFSELQNQFPGITQAQIAERSGKPESTISYLMAFRDLPEPVLAMLHATPTLLGSDAATAFAKLTRAGKGERVVEAIRQLAEGVVDQKRAVALAESEPSKESATRPAPEIVKIRDGKKNYCQIRRTAKILRLDFESESEAQEVMKVVQEVLEARKKASSQSTADVESDQAKK
ncbi:ParB/RepB/Spo0J family partition protein [Pandoraea communis]|uniref:ParB/RepB/Spo0J family partition protein n=1 Tax=Pandoraea communis TaxID=2508297 RepID=UPI0025A5A40F|nr:ParB N-terminal domain-containing protein [Pandoraea communis]MDM8356513.1 ParB N-terminal domain-containing protein [Pandoraea communis]